MDFESLLRSQLRRPFTKGHRTVLEGRAPRLEGRFDKVEEIGLYLHIPFCRQICPYCPYNKETFHADRARRYAGAVKREIDRYRPLIADRPVTSLYIGGGTPTTMLHHGLEEILQHVSRSFDLQCTVHLESHPNDLSPDNLRLIRSLGVKHLSIGVEALQDRHLRTLQRPYSALQVMAAVERAVSSGFDCVNADFIFALPGQTYGEVEKAGRMLVAMGVDQVAAYPLFRFPYTKLGQAAEIGNHGISAIFRRRKMLKILETIFTDAGFERTSVWAFTRRGVPRYCSVTVPLYVGLGASGGSYLRDIFYLNTFSVSQYIEAVESGRMPIALSMELPEDLQMAGWLYWRVYETRFRRSDFRRRFEREFDEVYGRYVRALALITGLSDDGDEISLSNGQAYWLHALQDLLSLDYVSRLWGTSRQHPWPERVVL